MTTLLAIATCGILYKKNSFILLFIIILLGIIQSVTSKKMSMIAARFMAEGVDSKIAAEMIPNGLTTINMMVSFGIFGLFAYSLFI